MKISATRITMSGAVLALSVTGCSQWPEAGQGGAAEIRSTQDYYLAEIGYSMEKSSLLRQLHTLDRDLDVLVLRGARGCIPAAVQNATLWHQRVRREIDGGLIEDAYTNLVILNRTLHEMDNQLNYLGANTHCASVSVSASDHTGWQELVSSLLTTDLQFDLGSDQINDAYAARLQAFASTMARFDYYHIEVTGHADQFGEKSANIALSDRRARKVQSLLIKSGIDSARIIVKASGEELPLLTDNNPSSQTWNRRVDLRVIDTRYQPAGQQTKSAKPLPLSLWETHLDGRYLP